MTRAEEYRHLAKKVRARAAGEESPTVRAEWENLAESYVCLAEQAEASDQLDPLYDRSSVTYRSTSNEQSNSGGENRNNRAFAQQIYRWLRQRHRV